MEKSFKIACIYRTSGNINSLVLFVLVLELGPHADWTLQRIPESGVNPDSSRGSFYTLQTDLRHEHAFGDLEAREDNIDIINYTLYYKLHSVLLRAEFPRNVNKRTVNSCRTQSK